MRKEGKMAGDGLKWACFSVKNRAEVSGLPMVDVGIAHVLALFCAEKCNGGRIIGAKSWKKVEWLRYVGLDKKLSKNSEKLWHFEGDDLVVDFYDADAERRMVAKREAQRANIAKRWKGDSTVDTMVCTNGDSTVCTTVDTMEDTMEDTMVVYNNNNINNNNKNNGGKLGVISTRSARGEGLACPPDDEVFGRWLTRLCGAHPTLKGCRSMAEDVAEAARGAFERCPQVEGDAELIGAYMADRLQEDRYRHKFWRPVGQAKFFENIEDVLGHARAWDREVGWSAKRRKAEAAAPEREQEEVASEEERQEFRDWLRKEAEK